MHIQKVEALPYIEMLFSSAVIPARSPDVPRQKFHTFLREEYFALYCRHNSFLRHCMPTD